MTYQYDVRRATPAGQLRTVHDQIDSAVRRLDHYRERIAAVKKEDARVREAARKNRNKVIAKIEKQSRPSTPEEFRADAEAAYKKSMRLFPDNAREGGRRLNAVLREVTEGQSYGTRSAVA